MTVQNVKFDDATEAVIAKVRKLLAHSKGTTNEAESQAFADKAAQLLEAYNLDLAIVNRDTKSFAARDKQKLNGGLYKWQRDLWNATAGLNFCRYWFYRGLNKGSSYEHELLGSKVNVISTQIMAEYLQDTVERLAREWVNKNRPGKSIFIKEAIAFREGVASRLTYRMWELRQQRIREDEARIKAEREENAARGVFTENALTISDVISTEEDLNSDFINGWAAGTSAGRRKVREHEQALAQKEAEELLRKQREWDEANPELAAARQAKEKAAYEAMMKASWDRMKNAKPRAPTAEERRQALPSYQAGYNAGGSISLDKQIDEDKKRLK